MSKPKKRFYVGCLASKWEVFKAAPKPTDETHGHIYDAVIGPFRTKAGAEFMAQYGRGNPFCRTVTEAEYLAKKEKENVRQSELQNEEGSQASSGTGTARRSVFSGWT